MTAGRRPLVGITAGTANVAILEGTLPAYYIGKANPRAIVHAGGDPVLLGAVPQADAAAAERYADALDAFVFSGGVDIAPSRYGATGDETVADHDRDAFEIALIHAARERKKPILGVCRGMEILVVALGGTIVDGVVHPTPAQVVDGFPRVVLHSIDLSPGSLAAEVYGATSIDVACLHHQAAGRVPEALIESGWANDGVVEAVEGPRDLGFLLGLLWHPEYLADRQPEILRPTTRSSPPPARPSEAGTLGGCILRTCLRHAVPRTRPTTRSP